MSNASQAAFRSHLMQQFVTNARSQARRPPISLLGWIDEYDQHDNNNGTIYNDFETTTQLDNNSQRPDRISLNSSRSLRNSYPSTVSGVTTNTALGLQSSTSHEVSNDFQTSKKSSRTPFPLQSHGVSQEKYQRSPLIKSTVESTRTKSTSLSQKPFHLYSRRASGDQNDMKFNDDNRSTNEVEEQSTSSLSQVFQNLIRTRRTAGKFHPFPSQMNVSTTTSIPTTDMSDKSLNVNFHSYWEGALERAVIAGCSAPNHKKTEPFRFIRIIGPSSTHDQLSNIAYNVSLRKLQQQQQHAKNVMSYEEIQLKAQHKRDRWHQIPAYLVTLVNSSKSLNNSSEIDRGNNLDETLNDDDDNDIYIPLPYQPPLTEIELEDYAAACAAVQNCLLSLHSENLATKWATGSIIKTNAFRQLIHAQPNDRVVALIMIGGIKNNNNINNNDFVLTMTNHDDLITSSSRTNHNNKKKVAHPRRLRRQLYGDLMVDL